MWLRLLVLLFSFAGLLAGGAAQGPIVSIPGKSVELGVPVEVSFSGNFPPYDIYLIDPFNNVVETVAFFAGVSPVEWTPTIFSGIICCAPVYRLQITDQIFFTGTSDPFSITGCCTSDEPSTTTATTTVTSDVDVPSTSVQTTTATVTITPKCCVKPMCTTTVTRRQVQYKTVKHEVTKTLVKREPPLTITTCPVKRDL